MFITDELRTKVNTFLTVLEERGQWMQHQREIGGEWSSDLTRRLAAERALHIGMESITDAASIVIDTLVMRDPANYLDLAKVLFEESVVTRAWFQEFEQAVNVRNRLVRDYCAVSASEIEEAVTRFAPMFLEYVTAMRAYLGIS